MNLEMLENVMSSDANCDSILEVSKNELDKSLICLSEQVEILRLGLISFCPEDSLSVPDDEKASTLDESFPPLLNWLRRQDQKIQEFNQILSAFLHGLNPQPPKPCPEDCAISWDYLQNSLDDGKQELYELIMALESNLTRFLCPPTPTTAEAVVNAKTAELEHSPFVEFLSTTSKHIRNSTTTLARILDRLEN